VDYRFGFEINDSRSIQAASELVSGPTSGAFLQTVIEGERS